MSIAYTLYISESLSRNLEERIDPGAVEEQRLRELHRIDYLVQSLLEDLEDLLPDGYTVQYLKEVQP